MKIFLFLAWTASLIGQSEDFSWSEEHHSPQEIQVELDAAERRFEKAKEMFNPWYTGPLLTPSASMMPPGKGNWQPYIFGSRVYGAYQANRRVQKMSPARYELSFQNPLQFGITSSLDIATSFTFQGAWQAGERGGGFGDLPITVGFPLVLQSLYIPQMKLTLQETFPTGRYQNLSSNGLNLSALGGGSFQTRLGLAIAKLFFWTSPHPLNTRLFFGYTIPSSVHVQGYNAYGGGSGTRGTVRPGHVFTSDLGLELSLTQPVVLCLDVAYTATGETTFSGTSGTLSDGTAATVGSGFSDSLSLAPGLEYNFNDSVGVVAGAWFSVYGRNSSAFTQAIISVSWAFSVR